MASSSRSHDGVWIIFAILAALSFILCQVFTFIVYGSSWIGSETFNSSAENIFGHYDTEITPRAWSFADSGLAYLFQAGWLLHILVNMFRSSNDGPFYRNPEIVSIIFLAVYTLNMLFNVAWLLLSNNDLIEVALVAMVLTSLTLYVCLVDFHIRMNRHVKKLGTEYKIDLFLFRLLLQNGVAMYAAWCTVAMLLNLTIVFVYSFQLTQTVACTTALIILAVILLIYVVLDLYLFERYLRYTFSTYVTIIWALIGSLAVNWDLKKPHSITSMVVLVMTALALAVKTISTIVNSQRKPLYTVEKTVTENNRT